MLMILFPVVGRAQTVQDVNYVWRYAKYLPLIRGTPDQLLTRSKMPVTVHTILWNISGKLTIMRWACCTNITGESGERKG